MASPVGRLGGGRMFVALSRFIVANDKSDAVRTAFRNRPHLVDCAPGFLSMQVMYPIDGPKEIWLVTHWRDEQSYRTWHRSHEYHESHKGIPKGLKLVPGSASVRLFEVFAD
jgi:heme oxygenase (mycobilin-producing)